MGVVHKLRPEVLNFILENKQKDPTLSCRTLTSLIFDKLQIKVSKSSINSIFKENNLSLPIGRRQKKKKLKFNMPVLPIIEGTKAMTLVLEPKNVEPQIIKEKINEEIVVQQQKDETSLEDKKVKEAEDWAKKLHDEECLRLKEKLEIEKQKIENEQVEVEKQKIELRALLEEETKVKVNEEAKRVEEEKLAKLAEEKVNQLREEEETKKEAQKKQLEDEAKQQRQLEAATKEEEQKKRLEEETKKAQEDSAAQELALKEERERWTKLAEEEHKIKQPEELAFQDRSCSGVVFLKALDLLLGGSKEINEVICKELGVVPEGFLGLTEAVIFKSLFDKENVSGLNDLLGRQYTQEKINSYYTQIKNLNNLKPDIIKTIHQIFTQARGVKVHFIDGTIINLDSQLHSTWSTQYVPYDFSNTTYALKNDLNKYFFESRNLVLFSAPGYDVVPKDFFSLLLNIGTMDKYPDLLTLFGNKLEDIEKISLNNASKYSLIFGLWPWQFTSSRKVRRVGEFNLKHIDSINQDVYLAEIEIDLLRITLNQTVSLKGCAIKTNPTEKIRLVILSNSEAQMDLGDMAEIYLNRWPNLEEAFHDFSRKIELFAYVSNTQKFFSEESCGVDIKAPNLDGIFEGYVKMLDAYLRWYFFPTGYTDKNFSFTSENFYKIPINLTASKNGFIAKAQVNQGYQFLKDLEYLTRRLNERQVCLTDGVKLYFENAFK